MGFNPDGINHNLARLRETIAESTERLAPKGTAELVKSGVIAINVLARHVGTLSEAVEGLERRCARLEESNNGVEASNRRLAEAMERLYRDGRD